MYGGDEIGALVLDIGSANTKCGYAGEDTPKALVSTILGDVSSSSKNVRYCGRDIMKRNDMAIIQPVTHNVVNDWDAVTSIIEYSLRNHLGLVSQQHPLMICEPIGLTRADREKLVSILFDVFGCPAVFLCKAPVLAAFSTGRSTALVVDSGSAHTTVTAVHDGYVLTRSVQTTSVAGNTVDAALKALIDRDYPEAESPFVPLYQISRSVNNFGQSTVTKLALPNVHSSFHNYSVFQVVRDCKETVCRVSEVSLDSLGSVKFPSVQYELPDGRQLDVGHHRLTAPEILFHPKALYNTQQITPDIVTDLNFTGIHNMIKSCISSVDIDLHKELYSSIILSGGTTLLAGLPQRLSREVSNDLPAVHKVKILTGSSVTDRKFANWMGGSILASLGTFHQMWLSKQEYRESGAKIVHTKCP